VNGLICEGKLTRFRVIAVRRTAFRKNASVMKDAGLSTVILLSMNCLGLRRKTCCTYYVWEGAP
jgi:hypothetical protein